jgi:hypothetical protein
VPSGLNIRPTVKIGRKERSWEYANGKTYNDEETKIIETRNSINILY